MPRRCLRAVAPQRLLGAEVEPSGEVAVGAVELHFREGVVEGGDHGLGCLPLQRELAVGAQALVLGQFVADALRHGVKVAGARSVDLVGVASRWDAAPFRRPCAAPAVVHFAGERAPATDAGGVGAVVAVLAHGGEGDADGVVGEGVGEECRELWREAAAVVGGGVVQAAAGGGEVHAGGVERARRAHVHGRADAAGGNVGLAALVHLDGADAFGGEVAEVEGTPQAAGGGHLATVQEHEVEVWPEPPHRYPRPFAAFAVDGDAGDALQRLGEVAVGEVADVLGGDGIHHAVAIALEVHRLLQALTEPDDDHLFERPRHRRIVRTSLLLRGRFLRGGESPRDGERNRRGNRSFPEEFLWHPPLLRVPAATWHQNAPCSMPQTPRVTTLSVPV